MRNGKTLLRWMAMLAVVTLGGVVVFGAAVSLSAATLEATDSGAPSAMVIFPVTDKSTPLGQGMRPAVFNHLIHEKKVTDCQICHHTGDQSSCTSCHTVEGKKEGKYITLERAMHATNIATRLGAQTPASCVSCHEHNLKRRECAGCHSLAPQPKRDASYCATCHDVTTAMTPEQLAKGRKGTLSADENEALATQTVLARKSAVQLTTNAIPYKVTIGDLAKSYEPNSFAHARHVGSLLKRMGDDKLAAAFHATPLTVCAACHHNSPLSATPPKCGSCHTVSIDSANPGRPALKAAYHLQCMTCHQAMKVSRPQDTSCTTCHKERAQ